MEFTCEICGKAFKNASGLAGHKQIAHGVVVRKQAAQLLDELRALRADVEALKEKVALLDPEALEEVRKQVLNDLPHRIEDLAKGLEGFAKKDDLDNILSLAVVGLIFYFLLRRGRHQQ